MIRPIKQVKQSPTIPSRPLEVVVVSSLGNSHMMGLTCVASLLNINYEIYVERP